MEITSKMAYVPLEQAKQHLNIEESYKDDDAYITRLINAAESVVAKDIRENLTALEVEGMLPEPLIQCVLFMVANFYANREPVAFAQSSRIPLSYEHLIDLYRNWEG